MNKLLFAVAAVLAATTAGAGVRIETVTRDVKTKVADGGAQVMQVQDGKVRIQIPKTSGGMILKNSILYVLDDKKKTYMEMDKETMRKGAEQAGAAMKQMRDQMAKMTPEQRAQMEKMMGGNLPPGMMSGKPDTWAANNTGKTDTSEGRKCTIWTLNKNGKLQEELCVVPFSSLPGKEDLEKTFKELAASFEGMANGLPGVGDAAKVRNSINGFPVRTRFFEAGGAERAMETVVTQWVEESVPAAKFEIPAGYQKKSMPKMGE
ncbi:MAG: DUF4412 domain-containing protein [Steroidobacteraceae bacterium]|nr:DUF4412 domain-containing protein [Steroidobacteraceae bacterium]